MAADLKFYTQKLEYLARQKGLDYFDVNFELVPSILMMEIAVYGLPVRMPHWSFGVRYIYQLVQHRMGRSHLFEVVFPGDPGRAFISDTNSLAENILVTAHVLGHADFSKNNLLFRNSQEQVGYHFVEQAAFHAHNISESLETYGQKRVECVLDAALALEQYIDFYKGLHRPLFPVYQKRQTIEELDPFVKRFKNLTEGIQDKVQDNEGGKTPIPPQPESDLLWFIANYGPELEDWERDIFLAVRQESFYFYPVYACQIMNEGWACLWHTTLLREADFLPDDVFLEAMKTHSDVVRPFSSDKQVSFDLNPYHIGFLMWSQIVKDQGFDGARAIMQHDDDFGFIRNFLSEQLIEDLNLFQYKQIRSGESGEYKVLERNFDLLKEQILEKKFNFGAPHVNAERIESDGTLVLTHDCETDSRGLDLLRAEKVIDYIHRVWRRPVVLHTVNENDDPVTCTVP